MWILKGAFVDYNNRSVLNAMLILFKKALYDLCLIEMMGDARSEAME